FTDFPGACRKLTFASRPESLLLWHSFGEVEGALGDAGGLRSAEVVLLFSSFDSMEWSMGVTFPNENSEYRTARNKLLQREVALRREMEAVAAEIRALPPGGAVLEDYEFDHIDAKGAPAKVRLSELFRPGTDTLILYHYMFPRHRSDKRRGPS